MAVVNHFKMGKLPKVTDPRTLQMARYAVSDNPPRSCHWAAGLSYDMDGNANAGDCVEAEYAHSLVTWGARTDRPVAIATDDVLGTYSAITGYNKNDPSTDRGTDMLAANKFWKSTGMVGHTIDGFAEVNPANLNEVKLSTFLFGGLSIGLAMPLSAQQQTFEQPWTVETGPSAAPGSWGGHCVLLSGYTRKYVYVVTWGATQAMTWDFFQTYCDEAYAYLSRDFVWKSGKSASGVAWAKLESDLAAL